LPPMPTMDEATPFVPRFAGLPSKPSARQLYIASELERFVLQEHLAAFYKSVQAERHARSLRFLVSFWPVALGLLLGFYAASLYALVAARAPEAMTAVFPLHVLALRPEICISRAFARTVPHAMIYLQFPIEGLLIRIALWRRVTVSGVCGQVVSLHLFVVAHLWLASGALNQFGALSQLLPR
jgi:hypothetical protein